MKYGISSVLLLALTSGLFFVHHGIALEPLKPKDSSNISVVLALGQEPEYPMVRAVSKFNQGHFRTAQKPRVTLEQYRIEVFLALEVKLNGSFPNKSRIPLVKTWSAARGGIIHV